MDHKIILFAHIPKAAGMTIWTIIKQNYPEINCEYYDIRWNLAQTAQKINHNPDLKIVMGHFGFGFHQLLKHPASYLTMLRNPIQRTISDYYYNQQSEMVINSYNPSLTWQEFCPRMADNVMTRFYSGIEFQYIDSYGSLYNLRTAKIKQNSNLKEYYNYSSTKLLESSKRNLSERFNFIGIVEQFDLSIILLKQYLNWNSIYYLKRNLGNKKPTKVELDQATLDLIIRHNLLDIELYQYAIRLFQQHIESEADNLIQKINNFQKSNRRYQKLVNSALLQDNLWNNLPQGL